MLLEAATRQRTEDRNFDSEFVLPRISYMKFRVMELLVTMTFPPDYDDDDDDDADV
jgi:hypothetical protein